MNTQCATVAGGCFWCTEGIFKMLNGVLKVTSGYSGGKRPNPTYEQVSTGSTGHAEAVQIEFDADVISFNEILDVFFATHDPTTLNQQGADHGTQYRSAIFYHTDDQKKEAEEKIKELNNKEFNDKIVTEVTQFTAFYPAENYHQDFYNRNKTYPYCQVIIEPKVKKLLKTFSGKVKNQDAQME